MLCTVTRNGIMNERYFIDTHSVKGLRRDPNRCQRPRRSRQRPCNPNSLSTVDPSRRPGDPTVAVHSGWQPTAIGTFVSGQELSRSAYKTQKDLTRYRDHNIVDN
jgi:hypothetical protein